MDSTIAHLLLAVTLCCLTSYFINKRPLPLPPGPRADPFIGHLRVIPSKNPETVFHEWAKKYGDVMHLTLFGHSIIVLNSLQAATDLLEKRSALYSDRPNIVVYTLMGWNPVTSFMRYGSRFRKHRRLLHSHLTKEACVQFQRIQLENAHLLVDELMKNKGDFEYVISRFSTSIVIKIAYGHQILSDDDEYIKLANASATALHQGGLPGGTLVDFFPILQYLPSWFPGTHYANVAREWKPDVNRMLDLPYEWVRGQIAEGKPNFSLLAMLMDAVGGRTLTQEETEDFKGVAGIVYAAGAETTWSSLIIFMLAMLLYPECQRLGQEEVDRVVGKDRLPTFDDQDSLPYVNGVVQETLRWNAVLPLGFPHRSTQDDIYQGMFIPKGSIIYPNAYTMSLNENTYADPTTFNPSRFLPKAKGGNEEPPFEAAFGFGRRICPGRHLATASIFIAIASIFSTLHISKAKDAAGNDVTPSVEFDSGLTSHPKPFSCNITPRSERASQLISAATTNIRHPM